MTSRKDLHLKVYVPEHGQFGELLDYNSERGDVIVGLDGGVGTVHTKVRTVEITGTEQMTDGSHTFEELYDHRGVLSIVVFNQFKEKAWKSKKHDDGSMFSGYFITGIKTDLGDFSYHYKLELWDYFEVPELEFAPKWDGHSSKDVGRLLSLVRK